MGASKIGGTPDLPREIRWPERKGTSLSFIAQIRLSDIAAYDREGALPHSGMLYFFYDYMQAWGFDPADRGAWRVFYYAGEADQLSRTPAPSNLPESGLHQYASCAVEFSTEITLPDADSLAIEPLVVCHDEIEG